MFSWLNSLRRRPRPIRNHQPAPRRPRLALQIEQLERRDLPAATVTGGLVPPPSGDTLFNLSQTGLGDGTVSSGSQTYSSQFALTNLFGGADLTTGDGPQTIFADGRGPGSADVVNFRAAAPVRLGGYQLYLGQDGPGSANRSAQAVRLYASSDGINYSLISEADSATLGHPLATTDTQPDSGDTGYAYYYGNTWVTVADSFATPVTAQFFRLELDQTTSMGARVFALQGEGSGGLPSTVRLDPTLFNANTDNPAHGDQAPGLTVNDSADPSQNITSTAAYPGFKAADAFGAVSSAIEPGDFIFADGGTPDTGTAAPSAGATVDSIGWSTAQPVTLSGYQVGLFSDPVQSGNRGSEQVSLYYGTGGTADTLADTFRNDGGWGDISRLFASGPITGDTFRLEVTRTTSWGPRVTEIDAIVPDSPPSVTAGPAEEAHVGVAANFDLGSFLDPGVSDGPWSVDVNWGDGSADTTFSTSTPGTLGTQAHAFADAGTHTVSVTVTNGADESGEATFEVAATNDPITYNWTGAGDQNWSSASNWVDQSTGARGVPTSFDVANFTPGPGGSYNRPSIVDPGFGGSVGGLDVDANYTQQITLQTNLTVANTTQAGGIIAGSYSYNVPTGGSYNWYGGILKGFGGANSYMTVIQPGATMNIDVAVAHTLDGRTLDNFGTVNWANPTGNADIQLLNGGGIRNEVGGQFAATFVGGTYTVTGSSGAFTNSGTVQIPTATTLDFSDTPVVTNAGLYGLGGVTAALTFGSPATFNGGTFQGSGTVNVNAGVQVLSGTLVIDGPRVVANSSVWNLSGDPQNPGPGVALTARGNLTVSNVIFDGSSPVNIATGAVLAIEGDLTVNDVVINNYGDTRWNGGNLRINGSGVFNNNNLFGINGAANRQLAGTGTFNNNRPPANSGLAGAVTLFAAGAGTTVSVDTNPGNLTFNNGWQLGLTAGTLAFSGDWTQAAGGTTSFDGGNLSVGGDYTIMGRVALSTSGTITANNVVNNGTIFMQDTVPEVLTIARAAGATSGGNYTQGFAGDLSMDITGAAAGRNDVLAIAGNASFDGTLDVADLNNALQNAQAPITWRLGTYSNLVMQYNPFLEFFPANVGNPSYGARALTVTFTPPGG